MTEKGWLRTLIERKAFWQHQDDTTSPHPKDGRGVHSDCFFLPEKFAAQSDLCGTAGHDLCQAFNGANDDLLRKGTLGQCAQIPFEVVVALDEHALLLAGQIAEKQAEYGGIDVDAVLASSDDLHKKVDDRNVVLCATYIDTGVVHTIENLRRTLTGHNAQVMDTVFAAVNFWGVLPDDEYKFPGRLHALLSVIRTCWRIPSVCGLCLKGSESLVYSETTHGKFFPGAVRHKPVAARAESRRAKVALA